MAKMRAVQVASPGGAFEMVEREIPQPGPRQVRVKVQACGLCHSDSLTKEGQWPGITYPRVPGHEIAGVIDAVGNEVPRWQVGQRVVQPFLPAASGFLEDLMKHPFPAFAADGLRADRSASGDYRHPFACATKNRVASFS